MKIYGLTGGIASGKSTVSHIFNNLLKIPVIDADILARQAIKPKTIALTKIIDYFGKDILNEDGTLNRKKLSNIVFSNQEKLGVLNQIVHPEIEKLYQKEVNRYNSLGNKHIIYDCPLLIEKKLLDDVDEVILLVVDTDTQLQRLMTRDNLTQAEAISRINSQMDFSKKIPYADYIIYNDGNMDELRKGILALWEKLNNS